VHRNVGEYSPKKQKKFRFPEKKKKQTSAGKEIKANISGDNIRELQGRRKITQHADGGDFQTIKPLRTSGERATKGPQPHAPN